MAKLALVTGGTRGLGKEIARQLAESGVRVLIGARDLARGVIVAREITALTAVSAVALDVTDDVSVEAAARFVTAEYGRLDILVNNAGIAIDRRVPAPELPLNIVRETFETNVFGVVRVTNAFVPLLREAGSGRIVNVSSELGSITLASDPAAPYYGRRLLAYNSSKAALNAMTVTYAQELAADGIKVNAVNPGLCATDLTRNLPERTAAQGAAVVVETALAPDTGASGEFRTEGAVLPW